MGKKTEVGIPPCDIGPVGCSRKEMCRIGKEDCEAFRRYVSTGIGDSYDIITLRQSRIRPLKEYPRDED